MLGFKQLFYAISLINLVNGFISVYESLNYDNSLTPESVKEVYNYYTSDTTNKYNFNKKSKDFEVIGDLLPGYQSIKNTDLYNKPEKIHSGRIYINTELKHSIFFWKFDREYLEKDSKNKTLTFFISGGPGCSSMDGLLLENGPFIFNKNDQLVPNEGPGHYQSDIM